MAAPVSIVHTHVHSLRIRSGAEALVARVLTADGVAGYGFSLELEAAPARDMAAWDALGGARNVPLYALFGPRRRDSLPIMGKTELPCVDPFAAGSVEAARSMAQSAGPALALVSPNAHPWEIAYCAALAATLAAGRVCIVLRTELPALSVAVPEASGIGVDWSLEPAVGAIRW
ncbi:MAG: hypothetical protein ACREVG_20440 [Burkholderiales bacterium]